MDDSFKGERKEEGESEGDEGEAKGGRKIQNLCSFSSSNLALQPLIFGFFNGSSEILIFQLTGIQTNKYFILMGEKSSRRDFATKTHVKGSSNMWKFN